MIRLRYFLKKTQRTEQEHFLQPQKKSFFERKFQNCLDNSIRTHISLIGSIFQIRMLLISDKTSRERLKSVLSVWFKISMETPFLENLHFPDEMIGIVAFLISQNCRLTLPKTSHQCLWYDINCLRENTIQILLQLYKRTVGGNRKIASNVQFFLANF